MAENLRPCPHCGPEYVKELDFHWHDGTVCVECRRCGMRGPGNSADACSPYPRAEEEECEAIAASDWNSISAAKGWRPIETAPKDDTPILTYGGIFDAELGWRDDDFPRICVVERIPQELWDAHLDQDEMRDVQHLYRAIHTSYYGVNVIDPTHWMPLPEPPERKEKS